MTQETQRPGSRDLPLSRIALGALAALCSAQLACSEPDAPALTPESFLTELAVAYCESAAVCPEQIHKVYPIDIALGLSSACGLVGHPDVELEEVLARGHAALNTEAALKCLDAMRSCGLFEGACELALVGSLGEGAGCVADGECASGRCEGARGACGQCTAELAQPAALGQQCRSHVDCAQGNADMVQCLSDRAGGAPLCTAIREVANGGACAAPGTICETGSYCDHDQTCRPNLAAGAACSTDRCEKGALCTKVGDAHKCIPLRLRHAGESCTHDFVVSEESTLDVCDPSQDLRCNSEKLICVKLSRGAARESCQGDRTCAEGLFCDSGSCQQPRATGESCIAAPQCGSRRCQGQRCVDALFPSCDA